MPSNQKGAGAEHAHEVEILHREEFSSAHVLHSPHLSAEENKRLYGPCNNLHGHNYALEVCVRGPVNPVTGMVMNLSDLMRIVQERIIHKVDHLNLNTDVPFLQGIIPTAEMVAVLFWNELEPGLQEYESCRLHRIRLYESRNNFVDYMGPKGSR